MGEDVIDGHVFQCNPSARFAKIAFVFEFIVTNDSFKVFLDLVFATKPLLFHTFDSKAIQMMRFVIIESGGSFEGFVTIGFIAIISLNMSHIFVDALNHLFLYGSHEITISKQINIFAINFFS
jgi:hypothetical protein